MATSVFTDSTNFTAMVGRYYEKTALAVLEPELYLYQLADKYTIPANSSNVIYFRKYTESTTVAGTLTQGTTPTITELSASGVNVTLKQRGVVKQVSDLVDLTAIQPVVEEAIQYVLAPQGALTVDKEILWRLTGASEGFSLESMDAANPNGVTAIHISSVLDGQQGGLSTLYLSNDGRKFVASMAAFISYFSAAGATAMQSWVDNCQLGSAIVRAAVRELDSNNAKKDGKLYSGITNPKTIYALKGDPDFVSWNQFGNSDKGAKNYVGEFGGVKWMESTSIPVLKTMLTVGSMTTATFSLGLTLITGKGAFGVTELASQGGVKMIVKRPSSSDTSNPLDLYSTVGLKITMAATPLNKSCAYFVATAVRG